MNNTEEKFEPLIIAFCCNWCSYAGADLAGTSRTQYPTNIRIIRVMCSGMIHPNLVMDALTKGADGVIICGCHPGDCHYLEGNLKTEKRADAIRLMLEPSSFIISLTSDWVTISGALIWHSICGTVKPFFCRVSINVGRFSSIINFASS